MAMNMKMCLIKFILFLQITKKINSYDLVCPSTSQWNLRASAICLEKNSYACLLNRKHEKYNENCQGPDDVESGRKLVFQSLGLIFEKCTFERYQPIAFSSFGNSDCVFRKSTCSEEGQVVCSDNSLDVDVSCRCDHTKGYKFVSKTRNPCYCIPSNEDCSCFRSDNVTEVVNSSCGNTQDVCIGTITTISGIRTNFSYGEHHNINIISDFKRHNNLLSHAIILILIGIVTVTIAYTMFATHLDGYYIDQFKKEIHPDKTNIHTKDEIEEHKFRDDGLKAKLITGPKLHKNKPGIEHLPMQDNANPIEESEHNKYQYQLFNNDFATGNCTDQINNEMNSDKTNMHTQHAMEETKYRVEGHKGKLITGLTLDKGQPDIDHQSKQTESETKHIEKCDQMTEEDFATGFQLDEDQPDIEHLSNQAKAETNHIEEREQNNYQFQLIEDVATGYYNDKFKYKVHSDNINIHTQEAMEEKNDRDEGQKVKLITGLELDEDKPGIEHQSMQDQAGTKHIEERNQMTENDVATGLGLDGDKPGIEYQPRQDQADTKDIEERDQMAENDFVTGPVLIEENLASNHQSCQCRDDELHIEESDDNKCQSREEYSTACRETNEDNLASNHQLCQGRDEEFHIEKGDDNQCQYKMSGEVHVTASSECTDQNKFISNADKPNPHPQDEIVQNRDRDGGPNADIITASSECTDQNKFISSADKPNSHPQDEIAQNRTRDGGPNADIITGPFQDNGCSNYEDKTECDADKTKLETKNVGADRKTLHEQSEPNLIPARHEQNNKSNPDIDNRLQVIIEEHSMKRKTSNDDISIREMAEAQCIVKDLSNTGNENNEVVRKENRRTETGTDCKDIKEKTEKHIVTTSKQDKDVKSKEIADKQYKFDVLVKSLGLESFFPNKINLLNVMIVNNPVKTITFTDIPWIVYKSLIMGNFNSRDKLVQELLQKTEPKSKLPVSGSYDDIFVSLLDGDNSSISLHPMDLLVVLFLCSSPILKHILAQKLFMCKLAIPICFPSLTLDKVLFSPWMLQTIIIDLPTEKKGSQHSDITNCPCHFVGFIRLGKISLSKSKVINDILTDQYHNTFFNKDCPNGTSVRTVSEGTIESAWFLPSEHSDFSKDVVMCMNLRGDGLTHVNQFEVLSNISAVVVVMLNVLWLKDEKTITVLLNLHKSVRGVVIAIDANAVDLDLVKTICKDYSRIIGDCRKQTEFCILSREDKETSVSSIKISIRESIAKLTADMKPCTLSKQLKDKGYTYSDIDSKYEECKEKAELILSHIPTSHSTVKDEIVPLQGETWKMWTKCCKTLNKTSQYTSIYEADKIRQHMIELRETELRICTKLGPFMKSAIEIFFKYLNNDLHFTYLIWWLKLLLDERSRRILPKFLTEYQRDWQALRSVKNIKQHNEIEKLKLQLNTSEYNLAEASFGLEHVVREIGQMYEAMIECKRENLSNVSPNSITACDLATIGARMLLNGQPFELMDGDTANVPLIWVKAVITELKNMIGDKKLLALSILGVQSSGKSTLLNTMFGVQFAVSAGRCTRGVFMQLVKVEKCSVPVDYIVVFDTEGLRAPELAHQKYSHDNELATFVIGLGDITIINIKGENTAEVKDVLQIAVHAFLRLKLANRRLNLKQSCVFIHQNVPASDANNKMMQGRQKFLEILDEMTKEAADQENIADINTFSQVINFDCNKDVWYLSDLWHGDPPMAPFNPGYSRRVNEVRNTVLYKLASVRETYFTITDTILRIDDLWKGILKDDFVFSFRNSLELKAYINIDRKYQELSWKLEQCVSEFVLSKVKVEIYKCLNEEDFVNVVPKILKLCSQKVWKQLADSNHELDEFVDSNSLKDIMIQWIEKKKKRLEMFSEDLIERSKASIKKTKEEIRIEKKRMDAQKTHEMEINQRVQILATELRGETPSEDVLKDKFNVLWETWMTNFMSETSEDRVSIKDEIESLLCEKFCSDAAFVECEAHDSESDPDIIHADAYELIQETIKSALEERKYEPKLASTIVQISDDEFKVLNKLNQLEKSIDITRISDSQLQIKAYMYFKFIIGKSTKTRKQQVVDLIDALLHRIDEYLFTVQTTDVKFDVTHANKIVEMIYLHIESRNTNHFDFTLTEHYGRMVTTHIIRYVIIWFTKLNANHRRVHSSKPAKITILGDESTLKPQEKLEGSIKTSNILPNHISMITSYEGQNWKPFTENRKDALEVTNKMLRKMDSRLAEYTSQDVRFDISFATEILMLISKDIEIHNNHLVNTYRFNLLPPYRAMIVTHVKPFITDFFVRMNEKYNKKHSPKSQMEEYKGTVWTLFKNVFDSKTESVIAAIFFREAITKAVTEYIDDLLPILVQEHIMTSFAHEKYALMKTIMIDLAKKNTFMYFSQFVQDPSEYTRVWLNCFINNDIFGRGADNCTTYGRLAKCQIIKVLKQVSKCIDKASNMCQDSGVKDISSWMQFFIQHSRDINALPFPDEVFIHVKNRKVEDLEGYIEVIRNDLTEMENDIFKTYDDTDNNNVQWKTNPNLKIMDKLWGCTEKCMFCAEPCRHTDKSHVEQDVQHQCIQHRPQGISGWYNIGTKLLVTEFCNCLIQTADMQYRWGEEEPKESRYYKDYKLHFPAWDIVPSSDKSKYWMWVMCKYQDELKEKYQVEELVLPETWKNITEKEAIESLSFA